MKIGRKLGTILIPLLLMMICATAGVFAGEAAPEGIIRGGDSAGNVKAGNRVYVFLSDLDSAYGVNFHNEWFYDRIGAYFTVGGTQIEAKYDDDGAGTEIFYYDTKASDAGKSIYFLTLSKEDETSFNRNTESLKIVGNGTLDITLNSAGIATIKVVNGSYGIRRLYIDDVFQSLYSTPKSSITYDTTKLDLGYHDYKVELSNGEMLYYDYAVPTAIYEKPAIKANANFVSTGSNYICFRPYFTVHKELGGIYVQFYTGGKWGDLYGPFSSYEILKTKYFTGNPSKPGVKIKANTTYKARCLYATTVKYGGKSYPMWGPYSNVITFKTGKSTKPAIKSVTVKCIKQKKVKLIGHAHWDVSGKWHPYTESYTWTTKYKVTVKLKKKPGTKGIVIGSKKIKGNKKTYTATFTDSGKLKGKKIAVDVCTYNDDKAGAYSPIARKKVKMK